MSQLNAATIYHIACVITNKHVCVTHISSRLLKVLVVHVSRDDLCGQRTRGIELRQLPLKLRLNEVQLPAGD